MLPTTNDVVVFMLTLAWSILSLTPLYMKTIAFATIFPTLSDLQTVAQLCTMTFATGVLEMLRAAAPPAIELLKELPFPTDIGPLWAVYLLLLEKDGQRPKLYIGSGTSSRGGVAYRMTTYTRRVRTGTPESAIPFYVERALAEGYTITHKGLLCWTPLPPASKQYPVRALILLLETLFTLCLWVMKSTTKDYHMPRQLCPWPIDSFTYDGLCSHFSVNESIDGNDGYANLTPEEIDALHLEKQKAYNRLTIERRGPGVHKANTKAYGERVLEEQKWKCEVCVLTFRSKAKLVDHQSLPIHLNKVAGLGRKTEGRGGGQRAIAAKKFYCQPCDHAAPSQKRLDTHLNGVRHAAKLRILAG